MAVLPLITSPDPRLKIASAAVDKVDDALRAFMDDMLETMYENDGIGLAAVQVGVHKRVLVMDVSDAANRYPDGDGKDCDTPLFMVNPEIVYASEEQSGFNEGCLSFPGQTGKVFRPASVSVKYLDYNGDAKTLECDDLLATCVQHEIDHLNGITFVDHLSRLKRDMILKKMQKRAKALA